MTEIKTESGNESGTEEIVTEIETGTGIETVTEIHIDVEIDQGVGTGTGLGVENVIEIGRETETANGKEIETEQEIGTETEDETARSAAKATRTKTLNLTDRKTLPRARQTSPSLQVTRDELLKGEKRDCNNVHMYIHSVFLYIYICITPPVQGGQSYTLVYEKSPPKSQAFFMCSSLLLPL